MTDVPHPPEPRPEDALTRLRERTPARIFLGGAGSSYSTSTQLALREDHAAALDAVRDELDLARHLGPDLVERFGLFEVHTRTTSKAEYLMRPDLGRLLDDRAKAEVARQVPAGAVLQVVIGDGLSVAAVAAQVPTLLPLLAEEAARRGWSFGRPFVVRHARVGILNQIGALLDPQVVVLLIGERPGLATAESLSAYLAYRPRPGHTDAHRNLISNIHPRGVPPERAARRIADLATHMLALQTSGVAVKEEPPGASALQP